jgi:TRAP-type uncharacterized transport system substrate-binding protein
MMGIIEDYETAKKNYEHHMDRFDALDMKDYPTNSARLHVLQDYWHNVEVAKDRYDHIRKSIETVYMKAELVVSTESEGE